MGAQVHPSRFDMAIGWEQQREVVVALRAGGRLRHWTGNLYELTVPASGVGVRRKAETTITVTRATLRALIAKGLLRQSGEDFVLTNRGQTVSTVRRREKLFTK